MSADLLLRTEGWVMWGSWPTAGCIKRDTRHSAKCVCVCVCVEAPVVLSHNLICSGFCSSTSVKDVSYSESPHCSQWLFPPPPKKKNIYTYTLMHQWFQTTEVVRTDKQYSGDPRLTSTTREECAHHTFRDVSSVEAAGVVGHRPVRFGFKSWPSQKALSHSRSASLHSEITWPI